MPKDDKQPCSPRDISASSHLNAIFRNTATGLNAMADSRLLSTSEAAKLKEYRLHMESIVRRAQARVGFEPD